MNVTVQANNTFNLWSKSKINLKIETLWAGFFFYYQEVLREKWWRKKIKNTKRLVWWDNSETLIVTACWFIIWIITYSVYDYFVSISCHGSTTQKEVNYLGCTEDYPRSHPDEPTLLCNTDLNRNGHT